MFLFYNVYKEKMFTIETEESLVLLKYTLNTIRRICQCPKFIYFCLKDKLYYTFVRKQDTKYE